MKKRVLAILLALLSAMLMAACGGGGGGGNGGAGGGGSSGGNASDTMIFSPSTVTLSFATGTSAQFHVSATPGNPGEFSGINPILIEIVDSQGVLVQNSLSLQQSGDTVTAYMDTSPNLAPGTYSGTFQVVACADSSCSSQVAGSPWDLPYSFQVTPGKLSISGAAGASVTFDSGTASIALDIQGTDVNWTVTTDQPWIKPSLSSGTGSQNITLDMSAAGLGPDTYAATVTVTSTDGQVATERVLMSVVSASTLDLTAAQPTSLVANAGTTPTGVSYNVQGAGLAWSVSSNANWLQPNVSSGSGSGTIALNLNTSGLAVGSYSASATVKSTDGQSANAGPISLEVYSATTPLIELYAGQTATSATPVDGPAALARFRLPYALVTDASGNIYVGDNENVSSTGYWVSYVRKISLSGIVSTLVGNPSQTGSIGGSTGLAIDSAGNLYVSNPLLAQISKITPTGSVSVFAENDGNMAPTSIEMPGPMAMDSQNNLYVFDFKLLELQRIAPNGTVQAVVQLGSQTETMGSANASYPTAMAVDQSGNILIADIGNFTIRKITPTGQVSILAGQPGVSGFADGTGSGATFTAPGSIIMDAAGDFYVADSNCIRKVTAQGAVTTIAGVGSASQGQFTPGTLPGSLAGIGGLALRGNSLYFVAQSAVGVITNVP